MELSLNILIKSISREDLMDACHLKTVRGYCQSCMNFQKNYSCPPHAPEGEAYTKPYTHITLIASTLDTQQLTAELDYIKSQTYDSETLRSYKSAETDVFAEVSMYSFDVIKHTLSAKLLSLEPQFDAVSMPPGKCSLCDPCALRQQLPCRHPNDVRFSLESLGFLVSELLNEQFDLELGWAKGAFPPYFITLSALASNAPIDEQKLRRALSDIKITY